MRPQPEPLGNGVDDMDAFSSILELRVADTKLRVFTFVSTCSGGLSGAVNLDPGCQLQTEDV